MDPSAALVDLGFTTLEADAYCFLLQHGPATAYRVSKAIARPTANTYQALAALAHRGAVEWSAGEPKVYRATDGGRLLTAIEHQFSRKRDVANAALGQMQRAVADDGVYALRGLEQVLERSRDIIAAAGEILLIDMFPAVLRYFEDDLRAASERGVLVVGLIYDDAAIPGLTLARSSLPDDLLERWPGEQLTVVADARSYLTALLSSDLSKVIQAYSSDSSYLACLQHSGLSAEIRLAAIKATGGDPLVEVSLLRAYPPGLGDVIGPRFERSGG